LRDEAQRVAYNVKATADSGYEYLLKNYTLNGQNLESGNATATGAGWCSGAAFPADASSTFSIIRTALVVLPVIIVRSPSLQLKQRQTAP